jgi:hypothetical protein
MQRDQLLTALFCVLICWSCGSQRSGQYSIQQKYAPSALREDAQILEKILESNHPSLYWYTPKEKMDVYFKETIQGIQDSLNEVEFRNRIALLVSQIRCGHTIVRYSNQFIKSLSKDRIPQFPLSIKTWDDSLVVLANVYSGSNIKRGTIITSINGRSNKQLLDSFFKFISIDGDGTAYKSQIVSNNFGAWYRNLFGKDSSYLIGYMDSSSVEKKETVMSFRPFTLDRSKMDSLQKLMNAFKIPSKKERRRARRNAALSLTINDSTSSAFMHLAGFSMSGLQRFMRRSFRQLEENKIQDLVIDVRDNGGGHLNNSIRLTRYLAKHPFKVADTVAAINRNFTYGKYIQQSFWFWFPLNFNTIKMADGKYHYHRFETKEHQPFKNHHFDGNIFLLQGPSTFSAASVFTASLKGQENVQLVGEETGGGFYGNSAIHLLTMVLPNTKIQITLPLFRVVLDKDRPKGRGVMPDVLVRPNSFAIQQGVDLKMKWVKEKIKEKRLKRKS